VFFFFLVVFGFGVSSWVVEFVGLFVWVFFGGL